MDKVIQGVTGGLTGAYGQMKGRNSGERVFVCDFGGKVVGTYIKEGSLESGSHQGACGMRKDNKRVYCCQQCYKRRG